MAELVRRHRMLGASVGIFLIVLCCAATVIAEDGALEFAGKMYATDGNTLYFQGKSVRLFGIDAPEPRQYCYFDERKWNCGRRAIQELRNMIMNLEVRCNEKHKDRHGRIVAVCSVAGEDLNAWMVANGWALANREESDEYVDEEEAASNASKGVWVGPFVKPWDWRAGER